VGKERRGRGAIRTWPYLGAGCEPAGVVRSGLVSERIGVSSLVKLWGLGAGQAEKRLVGLGTQE
jgi:hypothetical protein